METDSPTKVLAFKDRIKMEAEDLVVKQFPKKVLHLETLLGSEKFNISKLAEVHSDLNIPVPNPQPILNNNDDKVSKKRKMEMNNDVDGTKVYAFSAGTVPCNKFIIELVDILKPHIRQLVEDTNLLKMWVQFLIPRIEDGNNFGVSIQEDAQNEIRTVEGEAASYFDQLSRYFMTRGKLVSKVAKYPHIDDYRRTIEELDEKEFVSLRLVLCELRNHYSTLHDLITKNIEKIKRPRTTNTDNMY
jgi:proteasome activator subunit 3 (PA28 gamma)